MTALRSNLLLRAYAERGLKINNGSNLVPDLDRV